MWNAPFLSTGVAMKIISALFLLVALSLTTVFTVSAQAEESMWLQSNSTAYKTQETATVTINGISATPIQGFTAQIRYDPSCLQPLDSSSPISGMNGLAVPQQAGLADVSFASTTPQMANGVLAEVHFIALKACQTSLNLETAALVIRNESGFAAPVAGIQIDRNALMLNIDSTVGNPQPTSSAAAVLPLVPVVAPEAKSVNMRLIALWVLAGMLLLIVIGMYKFAGSAER